MGYRLSLIPKWFSVFWLRKLFLGADLSHGTFCSCEFSNSKVSPLKSIRLRFVQIGVWRSLGTGLTPRISTSWSVVCSGWALRTRSTPCWFTLGLLTAGFAPWWRTGSPTNQLLSLFAVRPFWKSSRKRWILGSWIKVLDGELSDWSE